MQQMFRKCVNPDDFLLKWRALSWRACFFILLFNISKFSFTFYFFWRRRRDVGRMSSGIFRICSLRILYFLVYTSSISKNLCPACPFVIQRALMARENFLQHTISCCRGCDLHRKDGTLCWVLSGRYRCLSRHLPHKQ